MPDNSNLARKGSTEQAQAAHPALHALSRYSSLFLLFLVCCVIGGLEIFVMFDMRTADVEAQKMYAGSVLGFRRIGELQYQVQETRRSTLYALTTNDSNLQVEYADQSRDADRHVSEEIQQFLNHARIPREVEAGNRLRNDWLAYLKIRDEVLASILEGSTKEAVDLDIKGGVVSFDRVREDVEAIKRLYDEQASEQLATVDELSSRSRTRLIAVITLTVLFASVSIWAIQRSRLLAAMQLARLQMDFVASISHELRTPLSVVRSAAENITDGVIEGPEQLKKYGTMIRNQTRQVTDLVTQILLFASTREGRTRYVLRPVEVGQIIETVLENTSELMQEESIVVECHIDSALPSVIADTSALSQCLQNLVVNAVKYSGNNKWIGINASMTLEGEEIRISVKDRGIGIASSELKRIFEPFYRSPSVYAAQIHGTGLGLPLAKRLAEAMGGSLSVSSQLGTGSVFVIHLPVVQRAETKTAAQEFAR